MDNPRRRHCRGPLERRPDVQGLAELQPGPGRRGAVDRLRRSRSHRALGVVVRGHNRYRLRHQQHLRQPLRQHRRRQPGQVDLRRARTAARSGGVEVPSVNIHTNQDAENPSVAGGSAVDPTKPGPWITWQETDTAPVAGKNQIFTVRPVGPASTQLQRRPAGRASRWAPTCRRSAASAGSRSGLRRVGANTADPSLNVDPTRDGIEPDIAFTGSNDSVPWVVWYETGPTRLNGLHANEMVFAAKGISDGGSQRMAASTGSRLATRSRRRWTPPVPTSSERARRRPPTRRAAR